MGTRETAALPRWTGFAALAIVPLLVVGSATIAGPEVDGGVFVAPLMLAYLVMLMWTVAVCLVLWRGVRAPTAAAAAEPA